MTKEPDATAETLFADWLQAQEAGQPTPFDRLLASNPAHADELRRMHDDWTAFAPILERVVPGLIASDIGLPPSAALSADPDAPPPVTADLIERIGMQMPDAGRYRFREVLGRGGGGIVLRVWDQKLHRPLAMKIVLGRGEVRPEGDTPPIDAGVMTRFVDEARIASQLDHPGIVPVHELGTDASGRAFFTMRLVKGDDFGKILARVRAGNDGWSQPRALGVLARVCEAVAYANEKGVVHRDLKPANVMVGKHGEVHVMDWGLARVHGQEVLRQQQEPLASGVLTVRASEREATPDSPLLTRDGSAVGTPAYMAPEQARGELDRVDARSDVYAIGAMLYELLTGQPPFVPPGSAVGPAMVVLRVIEGPPTPVERLAPRAPGELVAVCERAMSRDPDHRYPDVRALEADLRAYLEGRVVAAFETGAWAEARKWIRRNRLLAATAMAGLLALVGGGALALWQSRKAEQSAADATRQSLEVRRLSYVATMRTVSAAFGRGDHEEVHRLMPLTPEAERHWEWRHLVALRDTSAVSFRHGVERTLSAHFSPDEKRVVTVSDDQMVRIWDAASGRLEHSLNQEGVSIIDAHLLSDEDRLVVFSHGGDYAADVHVYEIPAMQVVYSHVVECSPIVEPDDGERWPTLRRLTKDRFAIDWVSGIFYFDCSKPTWRWFIREDCIEDGASPLGDRAVVRLDWNQVGERQALIDIESMQTIWEIKGNRTVQFSADGSRLLLFGGSAPPELRLSADGSLVATLPNTGAKNASLSRDGSRVLMYTENSFWIFDTRKSADGSRNSAAIATHEVPNDTTIRGAQLSPDGEQVLLATRSRGNNSVILCSVAEHLREGRLESCYFNETESGDCVFTLDGRWVHNGLGRVWEATTGSPMPTIVPSGVDDVEFCNTQLSMLGIDPISGEARRWDLRLNDQRLSQFVRLRDLQAIGFSDDGRIVATVFDSEDGDLLQLWDSQRDVELGRLRVWPVVDQRVRFSPDGNFAVVSTSRGAEVVDVKRFATVGTINESYELQDFVISKDSKHLLTQWSALVCLHDLATLSTVQRHYLPTPGIERVDFLAAANSFAAVNDIHTLIWPIAADADMTHSWVGNANCSPARVAVLAHGARSQGSPDPSIRAPVEALVTACRAKGLGYAIDNSVKPGFGVALIGESAGRPTVRLFTGGRDIRRLEVREASTHRRRFDLVGHRDMIRDVAISTDGRRIATAAKDSSIRLWDTKAGDEVCLLEMDGRQLFFSPDDRWLCVYTGGGWRLLDSVRHRDTLRRPDRP